MIRNNIEAGQRLYGLARSGKVPIRVSGGRLIVQQKGKQAVSAPFFVNTATNARTAYFR